MKNYKHIVIGRVFLKYISESFWVFAIIALLSLTACVSDPIGFIAGEQPGEPDLSSQLPNHPATR